MFFSFDFYAAQSSLEKFRNVLNYFCFLKPAGKHCKTKKEIGKSLPSCAPPLLAKKMPTARRPCKQQSAISSGFFAARTRTPQRTSHGNRFGDRTRPACRFRRRAENSVAQNKFPSKIPKRWLNDDWGATPQPARGTRALPCSFQNFDSSFSVHRSFKLASATTAHSTHKI